MVERFDLDFHGCHGQDAFIGPDGEGGYVSYADYARLEEALRRIIERSYNDPLGTSKVLDMRRIAEAALTKKEAQG